jgi:hypothetical protein
MKAKLVLFLFSNPNKKLSDKIPEGMETSKNIRDRVLKAREIQTARFADPPSLSGATARRRKINTNSEMSAKDLEKFAPLGEKDHPSPAGYGVAREKSPQFRRDENGSFTARVSSHH